MGFQFRANGSYVRSLSTKVGHTELSRGKPRQAADLPKVAQGPQLPTPLLAPGARMTVVKHTPSNKFVFVMNEVTVRDLYNV